MNELNTNGMNPPLFENHEFRMTLLSFHEEFEVRVNYKYAQGGDKNSKANILMNKTSLEKF